MTKWEYKHTIVYKGDIFEYLHNAVHEFGKNGWEMCGITAHSDEFGTVVYIIIFKRKIED